MPATSVGLCSLQYPVYSCAMEDGDASELLIAQVAIIDLRALRDHDTDQQSRLFRACCDDGFFYLDMTGSANDLGSAVEKIYRLEIELFSLPESELLRYDIDKLSSTKLNGFDIFTTDQKHLNDCWKV